MVASTFSPISRPITAPITRARATRARARARPNAGRLVGESWVEMSDASSAIEDGRELFAAGEHERALAALERALTLSGSGTRRDRSKPAELSLGERQAALYNIASARCAIGDAENALLAIEGCFKAGYANPRAYGASRAINDLNAMWSDDDLTLATRTEEFKELVEKYKVQPSGLAMQFDWSGSVVGSVVNAVNDKVSPKR